MYRERDVQGVLSRPIRDLQGASTFNPTPEVLRYARGQQSFPHQRSCLSGRGAFSAELTTAAAVYGGVSHVLDVVPETGPRWSAIPFQ